MDWIDFKLMENSKTIAIQPQHIIYFSGNNKGTIIHLDNNTAICSVVVAESYEQVKQKIMDAEKVDLSKVVEHLTRDDYETLLTLAQYERDECE